MGHVAVLYSMLCSIALLLLSGAVSAAPAPAPTAKPSEYGRSPSKLEVATWNIPGSNLGIRIYEADQSSPEQRTKGLFYHHPFLWLENPPQGVASDLDIPHAWARQEDEPGVWSYKFRVRLSDPLMRSMLERHLLTTSPSFFTEKNIHPDSVDVQQWPIQWMTVVAKLSTGSSEVLGTLDIPTLEPLDYVDFWIQINANKKDSFEKALASGKMDFHYSYSWEGRETATEQVKISYGDEAKAEIQIELDSTQRDPNNAVHIYQADVDRVTASLARTVSIRYRSERPGATPISDIKSLIGSLFEAVDWMSVSDLLNDDTQKGYLARYLGPLEQEIQRAEERTTGSTEGESSKREDKDERTEESGAKLGTSSKDDSGGGSAEISGKKNRKHTITDTQLKEWERRYGTRVQYDETQRRYMPHEIRVFRLVSGWNDKSISVSFEATVPLRGREETLTKRIMPINLVDDVVRRGVAESKQMAHIDAVPMWVALPWLGKSKPPRGYLLLDGSGWPNENWVAKNLRGKNEFPNESWVLEEWRGKQIPNLSDKLIGGTASVDDVGTVYDKGSIQTPSTEVDGVNFTVRYKTADLISCPGHKDVSYPVFGICNEFNSAGENSVVMGNGGTQRTFSKFNLGGLILDIESSRGIAGKQVLTPAPVPLKGLETMPEHVRFRWIMRVPLGNAE